jgi:hypothetical protein
MAINFNQSSRLMLIQLINEENNTNVPESALVLGTPSPIGGPRNTQITVSAAAQTNYTSNETFTYNRLNMHTFFAGPINVLSGSISTTTDLLPIINAQRNVMLTVDDIVVAAVSGLTVTLQAKSTSFVWVGSVEVNITLPAVNLADLWTKVALDGFVYPVV